MEVLGQISPLGVHEVVTNGWSFYQIVTFVDFMGNTNSIHLWGAYDPDENFNMPNYQDRSPDVFDRIYALDGPGYRQPHTLSHSYWKRTANFSVKARWNGYDASATMPWWIRQKFEKTGDVYTILEHDGGNGTTSVEDYY